MWPSEGDTSQNRSSVSLQLPDLPAGEWVDWGRSLPPGLGITKCVHDEALAVFGAYQAPWCAAVDMRQFMNDLNVCNLITRSGPRPPTQTASYSPLLHNCILYLGLHMRREKWPAVTESLNQLMPEHCASLILKETGDPTLSTVLALNIHSL